MEIAHRPLKIALIGYGKMGRRVEKIALERGHKITSIEEADVCIDFTEPSSVLSTLQKLAPTKKCFVIGTTGWYDELDKVSELVKKYDLALLYAPNFSIGVHLFMEVVAEAAKKYLGTGEYKVAGVEMHHDEKKDAPSGTALGLVKKIGQPVSFSSVRCGSIPGVHTLIFDSPVDQITLTHEARSRDGFALGAVKAAEWLPGKKGLFTLNDLLTGELQHA